MSSFLETSDEQGNSFACTQVGNDHGAIVANIAALSTWADNGNSHPNFVIVLAKYIEKITTLCQESDTYALMSNGDIHTCVLFSRDIFDAHHGSVVPFSSNVSDGPYIDWYFDPNDIGSSNSFQTALFRPTEKDNDTIRVLRRFPTMAEVAIKSILWPDNMTFLERAATFRAVIKTHEGSMEMKDTKGMEKKGDTGVGEEMHSMPTTKTTVDLTITIWSVDPDSNQTKAKL
ncbi:hypothetical protein BCR39DRAFT_596860 [Naematelia encephala]|uniref:Uncharacterized protein n=1 Tax=Naematelia encephala TaxID=71784 RepID=A0A1Y2BJU1_9TREE|nr:hypothetical protein BCR39DRAFT_596860 [Naematelia encephala]